MKRCIICRNSVNDTTYMCGLCKIRDQWIVYTGNLYMKSKYDVIEIITTEGERYLEKTKNWIRSMKNPNVFAYRFVDHDDFIFNKGDFDYLFNKNDKSYDIGPEDLPI